MEAMSLRHQVAQQGQQLEQLVSKDRDQADKLAAATAELEMVRCLRTDPTGKVAVQNHFLVKSTGRGRLCKSRVCCRCYV